MENSGLSNRPLAGRAGTVFTIPLKKGDGHGLCNAAPNRFPARCPKKKNADCVPHTRNRAREMSCFSVRRGSVAAMTDSPSAYRFNLLPVKIDWASSQTCPCEILLPDSPTQFSEITRHEKINLRRPHAWKNPAVMAARIVCGSRQTVRKNIGRAGQIPAAGTICLESDGKPQIRR